MEQQRGDTKKIKILHILGDLGVGGCEMQLLELCRRMDKTRFDLAVCWYSDSPDVLVREFAEAGVKTIFFDKFSMPLWRFILKLRAVIAGEAPDIVHTWLYSANFWGRWAAVSCGTRRIVTSYRIEVREPNMAMRITEQLLAQRCIVLANSSAVAKSLEHYYAIPAGAVKIIYNAISLPSCDRKTARAEVRQILMLPDAQKIVLMVARQHTQKNYPLFLRTARLICSQRDDVTFVAVGRGDLQEQLDSLTQQLGLEGNVRFVGIKKDVHRWLAAADIFCFTSDYEGFPNAVMEAMLACLPVVCTRFAGIEELITDAQSGLLVPLDDERAMAEAILTLFHKPDYAMLLGSTAQAVAQQRFDWATLTARMENFYNGLLTQQQTGT